MTFPPSPAYRGNPLQAWLKYIHEEMQSAVESGRPDLWRTEFKTLTLGGVVEEIERVARERPEAATWTPGDAPSPRPGREEPSRVCLVTCERHGLRFVTQAEYRFDQRRWFFGEPPGEGLRIVAWMDAPKPFDAPAPADAPRA